MGGFNCTLVFKSDPHTYNSFELVQVMEAVVYSLYVMGYITKSPWKYERPASSRLFRDT